MSEAGDYVPAAHWGGHDFVSAKRAYRSVVDRGAADAISKGVSAKDCVPKALSTEAEAPLVIAVDVSGSMGDWPATIFSKLPYLEHEAKEYLGDGVEISFAAVGDSHSDRYPIQVRDFVKGADLKDELQKLIIEGNGGGTSEESYDLAALYYARNCEMPEAIRKPIFIFIGDEGVYNDLSRDAADLCHAKIDGRLKAIGLFKQLREKFSVYVIRKPYQCSGNVSSPNNDRIQRQWEELLGVDHVVSLPDASRVVDVIFGILAKETGREDYFEDELKDRQLKDKDGKGKVDVVMKSLMTIHKLPSPSVKKLPGPKGAVAKSITKEPPRKHGKSGKSISLLDD